MKTVTTLCSAVVLTCVMASASAADPLKITFDSPPCAPLTDDLGNVVNASLFAQNCYAGLGALFSSQGGLSAGMSGFTIASDPAATSPPNVARALDGFPTLHAEFFQVNPYRGFGTNAVSFQVTGSVLGQEPWEVVFFSTDSNLATFRGVFDELVSFSFGGQPVGGGIGILGFNFTGGTPRQGIDDLTFNGTQAAATPEPSTWLLMTAAALQVRRTLRRRTGRRSA